MMNVVDFHKLVNEVTSSLLPYSPGNAENSGVIWMRNTLGNKSRG
jgi:hypothetical protein